MQSEAQIRAEMITVALQSVSIDLVRYLWCLHCFKRLVAQAICQPNAGLRCHNHRFHNYYAEISDIQLECITGLGKQRADSIECMPVGIY